MFKKFFKPSKKRFGSTLNSSPTLSPPVSIAENPIYDYHTEQLSGKNAAGGEEIPIDVSGYTTYEERNYENLMSPIIERSATPETPESEKYQDIWRTYKAVIQDNVYQVCSIKQIEEDRNLDTNLQRWYFGDLNRIEAESLLKNTTPSTFLVRRSKSDRSFILSLKLLAGPVAHIRIKEDDGFSLQGSAKKFYSIGLLITHFTQTEIVIKQLGLHQLLSYGLAKEHSY